MFINQVPVILLESLKAVDAKERIKLFCCRPAQCSYMQYGPQCRSVTFKYQKQCIEFNQDAKRSGSYPNSRRYINYVTVNYLFWGVTVEIYFGYLVIFAI